MATLLGLSSAWAAGWAVALHVALHHDDDQPVSEGRPCGLDLATHGHLHSEGTPDHDHPVVGGAAVSLPGRLSFRVPAMTGDGPQWIAGPPPVRRLSMRMDPSHDPPPRGVSVSILRI